MHPMIARRDAAQSTLDTFKGRPLDWKAADCARVAAHHLKALGYKPALSRGGSYGTAAGAVRALRRAGFSNLSEALADLGLQPIGWASHLVGDIVELTSSTELGALGVCLGDGRVLAFAEHDGCCGVAQVTAADVLKCWRVSPWPQQR